MTQHATLNTWVYGALAAHGALTTLIGGATPRLHAHIVPVNATFPCVVWTVQDAGTELLNANEMRLLTNCAVTVQAIAQGTTFSAAEAVADKIETAFAAAARNNGVVRFARVGAVAYVEVSNGVQYVHSGFTYEATVQ